MSWSVKVTGTPSNVAAHINKEQHMPPELKSLIDVFAKAGENTAKTGDYQAMTVSSNGHFSPSDGWSSMTLSIDRHAMAPPVHERPQD